MENIYPKYNYSKKQLAYMSSPLYKIRNWFYNGKRDSLYTKEEIENMPLDTLLSIRNSMGFCLIDPLIKRNRFSTLLTKNAVIMHQKIEKDLKFCQNPKTIELTNSEKYRYMQSMKQLWEETKQELENLESIISETIKDIQNGTFESNPVIIEDNQKNQYKYVNIAKEICKFWSMDWNEPLERRYMLQQLGIAPLNTESYTKEISTLLNRDYFSSRVGFEGEETVYKYLSKYEGSIKLLQNVTISYEGTTSEMDDLIICPEGVFIIEVKNIGTTGNFSIEIDRTGLWKRVTKNDKETITNDAMKQNEHHVATLERLINKALHTNMDTYIPVRGIIAIANDQIEISNYSHIPVFRYSLIMNEIRSYQRCISQDIIDKIYNIVEGYRIPEKKFALPDYSENLKVLRSDIDTMNKYLTIGHGVQFFDDFLLIVDECNKRQLNAHQ